jgi:hypothetical protein
VQGIFNSKRATTEVIQVTMAPVQPAAQPDHPSQEKHREGVVQVAPPSRPSRA